jgi:anthranilate phosphoribosyltransferase
MPHAILATLLDGGRLERAQARDLMGRIMDGEVPPVLLAALLTALRLRGETVDEITGFAEAMRSRAEPVLVDLPGVVDTCGTGGDGSGTFNISTATALVAAALGVPVAKHGNRAVSSRSGSADVLEALDVNLDLSPAEVALMVREVGIGFMFAPHLHPAMKHAMPVRRELGVRTVFNLLGPLTNPAGAGRQLLGVYDPALCEPVARVLGQLGSERAFVVHGAGGLDEVSPCGETLVAEVRDGEVTTFNFRPEDAGLEPVAPTALAGGTPAENAQTIRRTFAGEPGPPADAVALNTAFVAVLADLAPDPATGVALARAALEDGRAAAVLSALAARSHAVAKETS